MYKKNGHTVSVFQISDSDGVSPPEKPIESHTIDDAIRLAETGRYHYYLLAVCGLASIAMIMEAQGMAIVLPAAKCDLDMTIGQQGFISSAGYIGIVCSSHFWGFLTDTYGRMKTLRLAQILTIVTSIVSSFSLDSWMLLVLRFIVGICCCGVKVTAIAYLGEFHSRKTIEKYYIVLMGITAMGMAFQTFFALAILTQEFAIPFTAWFVYRPWRLYLLAGNSVMAIAAIGLIFLPEGPKYCMAMGRTQEAIETLQRMFAQNTGQSKDKYPVKSLTESNGASIGSNILNVSGICDAAKLIWNQTCPLFRRPHVVKILLLFAITFFMFAGSQSLEIWYPQILAYHTKYMSEPITTCSAVSLGYAHEQNATVFNTAEECKTVMNPVTYYMVLGMGLMFLSISIVVSILLSYFDRAYIFGVWALLAATASVLLLWVTNFYVNVLLVMVLTSTIVAANTVAPMACEVFPLQYKGMALGLVLMVGRMGTVAGINALGPMLAGVCNAIFSVDAVIMVAGGVGCFYILRLTSIGKSKANNVTNS